MKGNTELDKLRKDIELLRNENFQLKEIINNVPGDVYWKNVDGIWLGINSRGSATLKKMGFLWNEKDIIGKTDTELFGEETAKNFRENDQKVMRENCEISHEEVMILASGQRIEQISIKHPLHNQNKEVVGIIGNTIDITYLKDIERSLKDQKEKAEAANRAKTEFLANMSHDMKTPLSGIVTTAEALAHDQTAREQDRQFAAMISASGKQLSSFFTSCLDLSKLEMEEWASATSVFSVRQLMNDIHDLYLPKAMGSGLSITVVCDPNLPEAVEGHHDSLYRALLNLTGNALKFTEKGGVTLRAICGAQIDKDHTTILFQVEDTGMGIPEDKFKIIFEKLQRLTPSYSSKIEGSGIGLYIVDQFIKRMGGNIHVKSEVGKGSTFTVSVPMKIAHTAPIHQPSAPLKPEIVTPTITMPAPSTTVNTDSPRVLLVEDVPIIQIATKSLLNGAGFYVDTASSGQEALALCASGDYGVIYMDIGLPDMQGHEAARLIRQQEKAAGKAPTPIIALTGHGAIDVQAFCADAGMQGVLSKPLGREQADNIWLRYVKKEAIDVPKLTVLEAFTEEGLVFDFPATVAILGSEQKAKEMLVAFQKELANHYLPKIKALVEQQDRAGLRFTLHQLLGCLAYTIFPRLQSAVVDFQQIARDEAQPPLEAAYQRWIKEAIAAKDFVTL